MNGSQEKLLFLILELLAFVIPLYYFAVLFNNFKKKVSSHDAYGLLVYRLNQRKP